MRLRECRTCRKVYVPPGIKPGACSVECYEARRAKLKSGGRAVKRAAKRQQAQDFYLSRSWLRMRYQTLRIHGGNCMLCGNGRKNGVEVHVDHIIPRSLRPDLSFRADNLQVLCRDCNLGKGNRDRTDWRQK